MTYEQVVNTIDNKRRFGKACGRDVTTELMELLGHPEDGMHIIHIAGTNGKGSTAAFVSSILLEAASFSSKKITVGTFTSPHLIEYTERILVDGRQIPREEVVRLGTQLLALETKLEPTMFDYWLAMAMLYFKEKQVDYLVLETGLGGAKDSTSGLRQIPEVCAITSIGLEHTAYLGDTIEAIAGEKAGIIKPGTSVVVGSLPDEAVKVIDKKCLEVGATIKISQEEWIGGKLGLFGEYQKKNAAVAAGIFNVLWEKSLGQCVQDTASYEKILGQGLKNAKWMGRMDIVSTDPLTILDGAHNPQGVAALHDSLVTAYPGEKFTFIVGVMADKDYISMVRQMLDIADCFFTCTVDSDRSLQGQELANAILNEGYSAIACSSFENAYTKAKETKKSIVVFGSLYFIGAVEEYFRDKNS